VDDVPLSTISTLKQQGLSNNQILQQLEQQGYTSTQIFDALRQASLAPPTLNTPVPGGYQMQTMTPSYASGDTEELIEAIIDEKWNDLMGDINKVIAWKDATEARITRMEQQIHDLSDQFGKLQQAIVGKVGEYDRHILDVGAEVKAMEKVFSKVLPAFTDNVAELSRITARVKGQK